ncbi:DUF4157 domain-containing protein [Streptomyces niveiscabiei]|uniref:DUF4157 domain-containing protein n=1 Tax=Streptomyces niveiscabiei TaxID=164115 RepID=UPI00389AD3F5
MYAKKERPEGSGGVRRAAGPVRAEGPVAGGALAPQALAPLQRAIGNAAVARMMRRREEAGSEAPPVQRSAVPDVLRSPGRPLAQPVRAEMERRLGADFSDVRVHDDIAAQRSATEVGARAYTSGHHVVLGEGGGDRHTLAHELVHVVQQRSGPVSGTDNGAGLRVSDPSDRFEREAERTAHRVMSGPVPGAEPSGVAQRAPGTSVQRAPGTTVEQVPDAAVGTAPEAAVLPASEASLQRAPAAPLQRMDNGEDAQPAQQPAAPVDPLRDFAAATYTPGRAGAVGTVADGVRAATLRQIAWEEHWAPIAAVCKKYHYTIAVRETGEFSIRRIAEGAKPKPHTILEKSIKPSSVRKEYGREGSQADPEAVLAWLAQEDLDGFVGHWGQGGLLGVRVDDPSQEVLDLGIVETGARGEEYVPITVLAPGGGPQLTALRGVPNWQTYLYTGDYDLHEAYSLMGGMRGGGQIAEASQQKVNLLNRLNAGVANSSAVPVRREGTARLEGHGLHMEDSAYAMFQHGDQATYRMNQYLEAQAEGMRPVVAKLVKAVATESDEPMGWCRWGQWYVTMNKDEHKLLRKQWGLTVPNSWTDEVMDRTPGPGENRASPEEKRKQYKTARYTS